MKKNFIEAASFFGIAAGLFILGFVTANLIREPPIKSGDWSAWVQAIGSVAAIGVAIWVSHRQHEKERKREQERENDELINMLCSIRDEIAVLWQITERKIGHHLSQSQPGTHFPFKWPVPDQPFVIYDGYKDRIGKVKDHELRKLIIVTYAKGVSLLQSFKLNNQLIQEFAEADLLANQNFNAANSGNSLKCLMTLKAYGDQLRSSHQDMDNCVKSLLPALERSIQESKMST